MVYNSAMRVGHQAIFEQLRRDILAGKYDGENTLPSETTLARKFGVSRPTISLGGQDMKLKRRDFIRLTGASAAGIAAFGRCGSSSAAEKPSAPSAYSKALETAYDVDVFVAGGGPSGVAAAVSAARSGAKVFLAESTGAFGGMATSAFVPAFAQFTDGVNFLADGFGREVREIACAGSPTIYDGWVVLNPEKLKVFYDGVVQKAGVTFSFYTNVVDAVAEGDRIAYAVLASKRGLFAVRAKTYVDCTGDGDMLAFAGGKFEFGENGDREVQPPTLCSIWSGIEFDKRTIGDQTALPKAIEDGVFSVPDLHLPGFFKNIPGVPKVGIGNVGHVFGVDSTDERSLTKAMLDARRRLPEYERYYKKYLTGYEKMQLVCTAPNLGVRESRRFVCDYMLDEKDFLSRAVFPDEIGRYAYPIDLHTSKADAAEFKKMWAEFKKKYRYKKGESYGIPYRSLLPVSFSNALVAGRCLGASRKMQASIRVMPGCFITGQAAGVAAALAAKVGGETRQVKASDLQVALRAVKAYVPNIA